MANRRVRQAKEQVAENRKEQIKLELQRINAEHAGLKPSVVVAEAKPKSSPLHGEFEWDDGKAGHEYRLQQARTLIRVIVPMIEKPDGTTARDPFVWVPPTASEAREAGTQEGTYHPMSVVVLDTDAFARALTALTMKMRAAIAAAEELRDAAAASGTADGERLARIAMAIAALQTAGAAVQALH